MRIRDVFKEYGWEEEEIYAPDKKALEYEVASVVDVEDAPIDAVSDIEERDGIVLFKEKSYYTAVYDTETKVLYVVSPYYEENMWPEDEVAVVTPKVVAIKRLGYDTLIVIDREQKEANSLPYSIVDIVEEPDGSLVLKMKPFLKGTKNIRILQEL